MGRRPKPKEEIRDQFFKIRLTADERQALNGISNVMGISISACIRGWMHQDLQRIGSKP